MLYMGTSVRRTVHLPDTMLKKKEGDGMQKIVFGTFLCLILCSCVSIPVSTGGFGSKSPATGAAGGANTVGVNPGLEKCGSTLGTLSIYEDRGASWHYEMNKCGFSTIIPVLRLFAQQSGCFVVVERGIGLDSAMEEREFYDSGELRKGSNFGKGQMVSADYTIKPTLIFSDKNSGGLGSAIGGMFGEVGAAIGGSLNFKTAQSMITLVDNRSTVQVAVAEGSSRGMDIGAMGEIFGSSAGGTLGAYTNTAEGKVIVGALMDAHNNMVIAARNYRPQEAAGPGGHGTGGKLTVQGSTPAVSNIDLGPDKVTIMEMQNILNQLGFDVGPADGVPGEKTRQSIKTFQNISGLQPTGELDSTTIAKLRERASG